MLNGSKRLFLKVARVRAAQTVEPYSKDDRPWEPVSFAFVLGRKCA